ncbi:two pore domain potassium channel family protein [Burkholderia alba]|uniref:two pore domain potassium channel family protein n=1 Tax=Burkholderia alba TaxID=2683677 RepID=UPI002B05AA78|nr:two pore domain potassium channel family protein [Burkholderia alba]
MMSWIFGLALSITCVSIHAAGVVSLAMHTQTFHQKLKKSRWKEHPLLILTIYLAITGLGIALMHIFESIIWAAIYVHIGAINTFSEAIFYSADTMSTRGASGISIAKQWNILGAIEATNGVLLFGMSAAFIFAIMQDDFMDMIRNRR